MVKRNNNRILNIILIAVLLIGGLRLPAAEIAGRDCVEESYRSCVGMSKSGQQTYNELVSKLGEPDSLEIVETGGDKLGYHIYADFNMLTVKYSAGTGELSDPGLWKMYTVTTRDPEHRFGRAKIHVGSSRAEVTEAYSGCRRDLALPVGECYEDGIFKGNFVSFAYDENDIVISISFNHMM